MIHHPTLTNLFQMRMNQTKYWWNSINVIRTKWNKNQRKLYVIQHIIFLFCSVIHLINLQFFISFENKWTIIYTVNFLINEFLNWIYLYLPQDQLIVQKILVKDGKRISPLPNHKISAYIIVIFSLVKTEHDGKNSLQMIPRSVALDNTIYWKIYLVQLHCQSVRLLREAQWVLFVHSWIDSWLIIYKNAQRLKLAPKQEMTTGIFLLKKYMVSWQ